MKKKSIKLSKCMAYDVENRLIMPWTRECGVVDNNVNQKKSNTDHILYQTIVLNSVYCHIDNHQMD